MASEHDSESKSARPAGIPKVMRSEQHKIYYYYYYRHHGNRRRPFSFSAVLSVRNRIGRVLPRSFLTRGHRRVHGSIKSNNSSKTLKNYYTHTCNTFGLTDFQSCREYTFRTLKNLTANRCQLVLVRNYCQRAPRQRRYLVKC